MPADFTRVKTRDLCGSGFAITPSDSVDFDRVALRIYVGGTGTVKLVALDGTVLTYTAVPAGTYLRCQARRVNATGTTATLMVGEGDL